MSEDLIAKFIDVLRAHDCGPADPSIIKADDKWTGYQLAGDPKGKKAGYYRLKIDGDFGVGNYGNRREGVTHTWYSKSNKTWTDEEKQAWKERVSAEKAQKEKELTERHEEVALEAKKIWDAAPDAVTHDYLILKKIITKGLRLHDSDLLVPIRDFNSKLWGYQRITPEGDKLYLSGGRKQGCYASIVTQGQSMDVLCICEGYATGASIHEASGLPVVVAFDAGNLKPVAQAIRHKYPESKIILCADNDQWTEIKGKPFNTGLIKASEAALCVNGHVVKPDFGPECAEKYSDFNDLFLTSGPETVNKIILGAVNATAPSINGEGNKPPQGFVQPFPVDHLAGTDLVTLDEIERERPPEHLYEQMAREVPLEYATEYDPRPKAGRAAINTTIVLNKDQIKAQMVWKKYPDDNNPLGKLEPNSSHNILTFLRHHEELNGIFRLDVFSGKIMIHRLPPWEAGDKFRIREFTDEDLFLLGAWLERNTRLVPTKGNLWDAVCAVSKECFIDPPLDYMENSQWDETPRLHELFSKYFGADKQPKELLEAIGKMWLIGGVARQYRPGCKLDNIVVLEGTGGAKKSTALEILATINSEKYFSDGLDFSDLKNKDTVAISRGKLILEFQELTGLGRMGMDGIIKWLTIKSDECRVPYARTPQKFDRRFLLAGTSNQGELPYHGGIRRFWNIICGEQIDCAALSKDCAQLWAEAVWRYKNGEKWWIDHDDPIRKLVEIEQKIRITERALHEPVITYLADINPAQTSASKIISALGITYSHRSIDLIREVNAILREAGWIKTTARIDGKPCQAWNNPKFKAQDAEYTEVNNDNQEQEEIKWN